MKPSQRISKLLEKNPHFDVKELEELDAEKAAIAASLLTVTAIIQYLDEEYDRTQTEKSS